MEFKLKEPVEERLVSELMESYLPMYPEGESWEATVNYLYSEEPEHMAELSASLKEHGWRDPVVYSVPDDLCEGVAPRIIDGTHRMALAIREGVISIPATNRENFDYDSAIYTELTLKLLGTEFTEDENDLVFDVLRSFELNADRWMNSDVCYGSLGRWKLLYGLSDESLVPQLKRRVRARLKVAFPGRKFQIAAKLVDLDEDEDPEAC